MTQTIILGYIRVSTDKQTDSGAGLEGQRTYLIAEATRRGSQLEVIAESEATSGKSTKKRMVVGFVGNMRERMDTQALLQAMTDNPDKDFWFVGQTHGSTFYTAASKQANCKFWGTLRQSEAEQVVAQFDVAVVPFLDTPLVASMSPMKQETYAKGKVPTVTLRELKNL